jgi:beta-glucosidase-like glycosyl hydrolase/CubicO group peptidase (beta-lactamase class C family)
VRAPLALAALLAACRPPPPAAPARSAAATPRQEFRWTRETLGRLGLEAKAAQLVAVRANGLYRHPASAEARRLRERVKTLQVGAVVVFDSEVESLPRLLNELQSLAPLPLLVAADMERGLSFRIRRGVVPLPFAMAIGATRSPSAARFTGEVAAREGRALGVHWAFAPVADVNSNPANPVINIRSYAEDPALAAELVAAFVAGARSGGLMSTAKHFPGHGDTDVDTHLQVATLGADAERLGAIELPPFRRAVAAGVDAIMLGHIAVPALDPSGEPATLSSRTTELLRRAMGFDGLVVTDALDMAGAKAAWAGDAAVRAVGAGADMILLPPDPEASVAALVRAVRAGVLPAARLNEAAGRVLEAKERLGLNRTRRVDVSVIARSVARPEDVARAQAIARDSITLVRNEGGVLPLQAEAPLRLLHLVLSSDVRNELIQGIPEEELAARRIEAESVILGPEVSEEGAARILEQAGRASHVLASCFVKVTSAKGTTDMSASHARLLTALARSGRPVVLVSYGSPYLLGQVPEVPAYLCAYGAPEPSQRAAMAALFGEVPMRGRLPVTLPGLYAFGHGLQTERRAMTLRDARPDDVGFSAAGLTEADRVVANAVAGRAFPGAVLAIGKDGALVHLEAYGRLSYDPGSPAVRPDTLYDLASLTKVVVATTAALVLADQGKMDLDRPVAAFLPEFRGRSKERVTVRDLLTHSSGLDWWAPLYKELRGKAAYVRHIAASDLVYEPGTRSLYSDLGFILLGEVLERVAGRDLASFAREEILGPLGMGDTLYRPGPELLPRIAPTEDDPWRGRMLRGEVHDENAFAMGGVAPHAGLFGTASDLARFAQMWLWHGVYDHHRFAARTLVERFSAVAGVPGSTRALGWDTPSPEGSSAGTLLSRRSFGHTGFTGTSLWIDPERRLFVVLLTNRVHPRRDNDAIQAVRSAVADAVARALERP